MSEYTKGKLEIIQVSISTYQIWAKPKPNHKATLVAGNLNEDDAQELIRRWNAFEDGGIVEKLLFACKFAKAQIKKGAQKKALPILRAVIVKAKPE